jgi:hypothetical protein
VLIDFRLGYCFFFGVSGLQIDEGTLQKASSWTCEGEVGQKPQKTKKTTFVGSFSEPEHRSVFSRPTLGDFAYTEPLSHCPGSALHEGALWGEDPKWA